MREPVGDADLAYALHGHHGPAVILLHCLGGSAAMWSGVAIRLAQAHRVVALDLRGHGGTRAPGPWTIEQLADDAAGLLATLAIERAHVIGAAMGGMVAQLLAAAHPDLVERLVLANTASHIDERGAASFRARAARARSEGLAAIVAEGIGRYFTPHAPEQIVERVRSSWEAMSPEGYAWSCEALAAFDARPAHARIMAPVLVVGSAGDPTSTPERAGELAASLPRARVAMLERGAHLACVEEEAAFSDLVLSFLRA